MRAHRVVLPSAVLLVVLAAGTRLAAQTDFQRPIYDTGGGSSSASAFAYGDLDGDGDADVVTGNSTQSSLSLIAGLGAAGFAAPVTHALGARPQSLVLTDLDGDGALDVAVRTSNPSSVKLLLGDGLGGLFAPSTLATPATGTGGLVAADLDGDGDFDLATGSGTDLMLLRNGPGGFASPQTTPAGLTVFALAAADADDDGTLDLLVTTSGAGSATSLARMPGTGGGAFDPPVPLLAASLFEIAVDDVDDDGRLDVLGLVGGLGLFRGVGGGALATGLAVPLAADAAIFALADLDGDGVDDLVSASSMQSTPFSFAGPVSVQLGDGAGGWGPPQQQPVEAVDFIELADVTGDGAPDLLTTTSLSAASIVIAAGDGAGGFAAPVQVVMPSQAASNLAAADFDGDGDVDFVALGIKGGFLGTEDRYLIAFRNDGGGQWTNFPQFYTNAFQGAARDALALGDGNGDGLPDIVVLNRSGGLLDFFAGPGGGPFSGPVGFPSFLGASDTPGGEQPLVLADLDGDGHEDIVVAGPTVKVRHGDGTGAFGPAQTVGAGPGDDLRWLDFDGDGSGELVMDGSAGSPSTHVVMVFRADGRGGFRRDRYFTEAANRSFLTDADQDGLLDLLTVPSDSPLAAPVPNDGHLLNHHALYAAWTDLGHGLAGSSGVPVLAGLGTLAPGSAGALRLSNANPNKLAVLFISPFAQPTPFKGGTLVPLPVTIMFTLATSAAGTIQLSWPSWTVMPPGTDWFFQYGIVDAAGPAGASFSNALRALQP